MSSDAENNLTTLHLQQQLEDLRSQLQATESRLQSFLSLSQQAFCCLEFDPPIPTHLPTKDQAAMMLGARVADCNEEFVHLCGVRDADELIGNRFVSLMDTANDSLIERARRFIRSGYRVDHVRNSEVLHDGTTRYFLNSSCGEIRDGNLVRAWMTGRDVTHQVLIEAAAKQSESALQSVAEQLDSAFWIMDWKRFETLYAGPAIERRWGISLQRLLEDPLCWLKTVHDHDRQRVRDAFLTHAGTGMFDETFRVKQSDGAVGWVRNRCIALPDATNDELRVVGLVQDISETRRAKTGLISLFQLSSEMLFVLDVNGRLLNANGAMQRALGFEDDELNTTSLFDLLPPEEQQIGRQTLSQLASGKPAVEIQCRFVRRDGTACAVEWNATPAIDDRMIYSSARDISADLTDQHRRVRRNAAATRLDQLSPREHQVAEMVVSGKANKVIARELDLSKRTVETHRANLMKKLKLSTTAELIHLALQAAD